MVKIKPFAAYRVFFEKQAYINSHLQVDTISFGAIPNQPSSVCKLYLYVLRKGGTESCCENDKHSSTS